MDRTETNRDSLHLVTTFALRPEFDLEPTRKALACALSMPEIASINIFSESPVDEVLQVVPRSGNSKVRISEVTSRPTISKLFEYCNDLGLHDGSIVMLCNSDVMLFGADDVAASVRTLRTISKKQGRAALVLTRYQQVQEKLSLELFDEAGLPNTLSADCWFLTTPLPSICLDYVSLGDMNCDLMIAYSLTEMGFTLANPCCDIRLLHYEEEKGLAYYERLNAGPKALDQLGWHWATNCNHPYKTIGVPWTTSTAISEGYLPNRFVLEREKIYFILSPEWGPEQASLVVAFLGIVSRTLERDLVICHEHESPLIPILILRVAPLWKHLYFLPLKIGPLCRLGLLQSLGSRNSSSALVSRIDYLTPIFVQSFHSVVVDLRGSAFDQEPFAPVNHYSWEAFFHARHPDLAPYLLFSPDFQDKHECTLITSLFRTDEFIEGFKQNITGIRAYSLSPHIIMFSETSPTERQVLKEWSAAHSNVILCSFAKDPGLYECWNIGIKVSQTDFISNANVDDLRSEEHLQRLVNCLRHDSRAVVAASTIVPFYTYGAPPSQEAEKTPWYSDFGGYFGFEQLATLDALPDSSFALIPRNIPHCMPVWRRSLHELYGYFDEPKFGTFADWAFWLKVLRYGKLGFLDAGAVGFYFVNNSSHNRRGAHLEAFHASIEREFIPEFFYKSRTVVETVAGNASAESRMPIGRNQDYDRKLKIIGLEQSFGQHRNDFNKLIEALQPLHDDNGKITFIPFIERYFVWGSDDGEAASLSPRPIESDWIGVLHVPFDAPKWFEYSVSPESIFATELWRKSLPHCRGIICLSHDLERDLKVWYPQIETMVAKHPTELNVTPFDWDLYRKSPRVVQAGDWLRRLQFIYEIEAPSHQKICLTKACTLQFLEREIQVLGDRRNGDVTLLDYVSNEEYDALLSSSVAAVWLYGASANNLVLECIARKTPLLINPLPAVVEYIGLEYPLYATTRDNASLILADPERVRAAWQYLSSRENLRLSLSYDTFFNTIASSNFYKSL
jgi:hypothetical protein